MKKIYQRFANQSTVVRIAHYSQVAWIALDDVGGVKMTKVVDIGSKR